MSAVPEELRLCAQGKTLRMRLAGAEYVLPAEYLRVCSPSAEVRGHGGEWHIIGGKKDVVIHDIMPVGQYAVRLRFSDGHDSGIYTWAVLADLAYNQQMYWQQYLAALQAQGGSREANLKESKQ